MPLLNYTTTVSVAKTGATIIDRLVKAGARQVMGSYENGRTVGLAFMIDTTHGPRQFSLPVHADRVFKVLRADRQVPNRYKTEEQAERVAWRILKDWMEAQIALVETEMVTLDEVMLPYMHIGLDKRTVWELYLDQQLAIGPGDVRDS